MLRSPDLRPPEMRSPALSTLAATLMAGFTLAAAILLSADRGAAEQRSEHSGQPPINAPRMADLKASLDASDELAALEALQVALTEVGDRSTYVWYRANGRLSAVFQPTASFKDPTGRVCRHLEVMLTSGTISRKTEGIACREPNGVWSLEG